jgi:hypothetical protein
LPTYARRLLSAFLYAAAQAMLGPWDIAKVPGHGTIVAAMVGLGPFIVYPFVQTTTQYSYSKSGFHT